MKVVNYVRMLKTTKGHEHSYEFGKAYLLHKRKKEIENTKMMINGFKKGDNNDEYEDKEPIINRPLRHSARIRQKLER